jgi:DNA-binding FadR family transcriptional regulator
MKLTAPARTLPLSSQVARQLERLITSGEWPVGKRIPAESELVIRLGLSRNTVREALRSLVHMGMLEARVGDGTHVRAFSELQVPLMRRARRARLDEAVELRSILERAAAVLAAERRTDAEAERLLRLAVDLEKASQTGDPALYASADSLLHEQVVRIAGNELLAEVYEHLGGALKLSVSPELYDQALAMQELETHLALVNAISNRDSVAADQAASRLIEELRAALLVRGGKIAGTDECGAHSERAIYSTRAETP